jgi:nucleoside-diphosphate kinase
MLERTLAIIKPNSMTRKLAGRILAMWEDAGFEIAAMKMARLTLGEAEGFYREHKGKPFFPGLVDFMTSGPVVLLVLQKEGAIAANRALMGATDPAQAADGTIRKLYGETVQRNCVHGSDRPESAAREIAYFFNAFELPPRPE